VIGRDVLVSAIIPFLDGEQFLRQAIESVSAQTHANWELLLVDDGSSDGSTAIALEYANAHPGRIRYLEHDGHRNLGLSASRNLGIRHAKGEYVAFLDADDVWLPRKLEQQAAIMESHPTVGMLCGPSIVWQSWNGKANGDARDFVRELTVEYNKVFEPPTLLRHFVCDDSATPCPGSLLMRRGLFELVEGFQEEFRDMYEDQVFYAKVCLVSPIFVSDTCSFKYRKHPGSVCAVAMREGRHVRARRAFLEWLTGYLSARGVVDEELGKILRRELLLVRHPARAAALRRVVGVASALRHPSATARSLLPASVKQAGKRIRDAAALLSVPQVRARMAIGCEPLSQSWGFDRGLPIHRHYVECFLQSVARDIHGECLEFQEDSYTSRFGGSAVRKVDILHLDASNPHASIVADLTQPNDVPSDRFDCIICTHVLHVVADVDLFVRELRRILKPGGVLLVASPFVSMSGPRSHELCRFTPEGLELVLARAFGTGRVSVRAYGNSLTAAGELRGLVAAEFSSAELALEDARFAVEVCARAVK
jgi:glycosyltransferase involved in cell wall biosynthesis